MNSIEAEITALKADMYDTICDLQIVQNEYTAAAEKLKKAQAELKDKGDKLKAKCKELENRERLHVVEPQRPEPQREI